MENAISEYQRWKQQGESLRIQAKQAMESRFRELLTEAARISQEYHADFGLALKPPPQITAFRFKAAAGKAQKAGAKNAKGPAVKVAAPAPLKPTTNPKITALEKRLAQAKAKLDAAKAAGKPTRNHEDKIYEIEDELRLANQPAVENSGIFRIMRFPITPAVMFCLATFMIAAGPVRSEVLDSAAGGFTVRTTVTIKSAPADVYSTLVLGVGKWWNPQHTFSHDSSNLSIEARPMGCFCEKLPNGGGVRHMEVIFVDPGKGLLMHGGIGPMLSQAVTGSMEIQLSAAKEGTNLVLTYAVTGYVATGLNKWAAPTDSVVSEQMNRLKNYLERGDPAAVLPKSPGL